MTTVSETIIPESAEMQEPREHITEQTSTIQNTQEDTAEPFHSRIQYLRYTKIKTVRNELVTTPNQTLLQESNS
jgi:hypothetical protein